MNLQRILEGESRLTLETLQRFQREYDIQFVDGEFTGFDKIRHTYAHMGKLFGRLAEYVPMIEDDHHDFSADEIKEKVIPDLLIYSAWLAQELNVTLEKAYLQRVADNIRRLHQDKMPAEELRQLDAYIDERCKEK